MKKFSPFFYLDSVTLIFPQLYARILILDETASTTGRVITSFFTYE